MPYEEIEQGADHVLGLGLLGLGLGVEVDPLEEEGTQVVGGGLHLVGHGNSGGALAGCEDGAYHGVDALAVGLSQHRRQGRGDVFLI